MLIDTRRNAFDKKRKHSKSQRPCKAMKKPAEYVFESGYEALEEVWAAVDSCHTTVTKEDQTYLQQLQMENYDGCIRFIQNDMNGVLASSKEEDDRGLQTLLRRTTQCFGYSEIVQSGKMVPPSLVLNPYKHGTGKGSTMGSNNLLALLSECGGSADETLLLRLRQHTDYNGNPTGGTSFSFTPVEGSIMTDTIDEDEGDVGNTDLIPVATTTAVTAGGPVVRRKVHGKNKHGFHRTSLASHNTTNNTSSGSSSSSSNNNNRISTPLQSEQTKGVDARQLSRRQWLCRQLSRMMAVDGDGDVNLFPAMSSSSPSSSTPFTSLSNGLTNGLTTGSTTTTSYGNAAASSCRGSTRPSSSSSSSSNSNSSNNNASNNSNDYSRARAGTGSDNHPSHEGDVESSISNGSNGRNGSSDYHSLRLGKRGRRYREVWEEEDYLSSLLLNRSPPPPPPQGTASAKTGSAGSTKTRTGTGKETASLLSLEPIEDWSELIHSYSDTHDGYYRDWSVYYANHIATLMRGKEKEVRAAAKLSANPAVKAMADHPGATKKHYTLSTYPITTYQHTLSTLPTTT